MADALQVRIGNNCGLQSLGGANNVTLSATDSGLAWAFQPHAANAITDVGFRYGARTGTPPTYVATLEGLDASGLPDGVDVGGGSPTAKTFTPPADTTWDATWRWITLTNAYTPTRGQRLCITIRYSSGTINAGACSSVSRFQSAFFASATRGFPYSLNLSGGTWSKQGAGNYGYKTASGSYGDIATTGYVTATANTAGHRSGMYFTIPSGWCSTFKVVGFSFSGRTGAAAGSCTFGLWDTSWNVIQSVTIDSDHSGSTGAASDSPNRIIFGDASLTALTAGTKYYIGMEVVSGTVGMDGVNFTNAADDTSFPFGGNRGLVTYDGTTHETTTTMPLCELILDDITAPAGGGGSAILVEGPGLVQS